MAKLKPRIFRFLPSTSPDVVAYRIFVDATGQVDYNSPHSDVVGPDASTPPPVDTDGKVRVDLANLDVSRTKDGVYDIGVVSIDDVGNESDIAVLKSVALDFIAPAAPTGLELL